MPCLAVFRVLLGNHLLSYERHVNQILTILMSLEIQIGKDGINDTVLLTRFRKWFIERTSVIRLMAGRKQGTHSGTRGSM